MPKRSSKKHPKEDPNQAAFRILKEATEEAPKSESPDSAKNPAAVELGRLGGLKGGKARAAKLSAEERSKAAKKAAEKRWANHRKEEPHE